MQVGGSAGRVAVKEGQGTRNRCLEHGGVGERDLKEDSSFERELEKGVVVQPVEQTPEWRLLWGPLCQGRSACVARPHLPWHLAPQRPPGGPARACRRGPAAAVQRAPSSRRCPLVRCPFAGCPLRRSAAGLPAQAWRRLLRPGAARMHIAQACRRRSAPLRPARSRAARSGLAPQVGHEDGLRLPGAAGQQGGVLVEAQVIDGGGGLRKKRTTRNE